MDGDWNRTERVGQKPRREHMGIDPCNAPAPSGTIDGMRRDSQRGATAVEMALIGTLVIGLVFAIIEVSMAFRTRNSVGNAVSSGVRAASVGTNNTTADFNTVQAIADALDITGVDITRVVVYRATSPTDSPSAACSGGTSVAGECNVYTPVHFALTDAQFGCGVSAPDRFYCPTSRSADVGSLELVGVEVTAEHHYMTGFLGDTFTFTTSQVLPVEPSG